MPEPTLCLIFEMISEKFLVDDYGMYCVKSRNISHIFLEIA